MYSLYRAWLSLGPPVPMPTPTDLRQTTAPDVTLHVGPTMTQFSAHRNVLSAHSGFFKAALASQTTTDAGAPIAVPNINVDEFSSLLTFMYTGYLDLNLGNIYNIVLATHILHMPRALEICRGFLVQNQPHHHHHHHHQTPTIIKPIASKKTAPPCQPIFAPTSSNLLRKSEDTPFKTVEKPELTTTATANVKASTSKAEPKKMFAVIKKKRPEGAEKIVLDVACCDGPVRFHRVVNKNYGLPTTNADVHRPQSDKTSAMNKLMTTTIRDKQLADEENRADNNNSQQRQQEQQQPNPADLYTCVYCNHTFKSQYCYQKHARRHLNPVIGLDGKGRNGEEAKREVKLLDMNVQYYPCKTCGCKFPSYYFVHKHRKLCHAEEMEGGAKSEEACSQDSCTIDVETVNQ